MFENGVLGLIPQKEWIDVGFNVTRQSDPIDGLFGDTKTDNLVAYWQSIAAEYQIPMMAQFHAFDTESKKTFRVPVDTHNIEKGLIKVKINQSERLRQLTRSGVREDALYDYVLNDGIRLADQVVTRTKVAKNELMATGKVSIKENNIDVTVDYGVKAEQTGFAISFAEGADVLAQIQDIVDAARAKGVILNGMMTSSAVISKMRKNAGLQKAIGGVNGEGQLIKRTALEAFLQDEFGIGTVITNDLMYGVEESEPASVRPLITTARYYPEDKITFFGTNPGGKLGIGAWGNPPEVDMGNFYSVGTEPSVSPFVYVSQKMEWDPAVLWTKASALFMPILYNPSSLWIATTTDNPIA